MAARNIVREDPFVALRKRDRFAHVANDVLDASVGAAAGGAIGILAGPVGVVAGAALGAVAGGLLGHQADEERHEAAEHDRELDDIDAEEEFFGHARMLGMTAENDAVVTPHVPFIALQNLKDEHRLIERVLEALEVWAEELFEPDAVDGRTEAVRFVTFFRTFVEESHDMKEEGILFEVMHQAGFSRERAPITVMLREHSTMRELVGELDGFAAKAHPWTDTERERVVGLSVAYADAMRRHIMKEDTVLYPAAELRLPVDARAEIEARFAAFAQNHREKDQAAIHVAHALIESHVSVPEL